MCEHVAPAALPSELELVHRPPLGRLGRHRRQVRDRRPPRQPVLLLLPGDELLVLEPLARQRVVARHAANRNEHL